MRYEIFEVALPICEEKAKHERLEKYCVQNEFTTSITTSVNFSLKSKSLATSSVTRLYLSGADPASGGTGDTK